MESMDRLALIHGRKIVETTVRFSIKSTPESIDGLATIQGEKIVEITVRFPKKEKDRIFG